jgi:hypothetical protein
MPAGIAVRWLIVVTLGCLIPASHAIAGEKPEAVLQDLVQMFPGHYDNTAQVQAEGARAASTPHEAVVLDIVPIESIMVGENVFYVQESVAGEPNRVLGQKIVMFGVVKKDVVQTEYALIEPHRWRDGHLNPDLFKGLMVQDLRTNKGCSLRWKPEGGKLVGANDPRTCHARAVGAGGVTSVLVRAELGPAEYSIAEQVYDKAGHLAQAHQDDPFYRFRKISRGGE